MAREIAEHLFRSLMAATLFLLALVILGLAWLMIGLSNLTGRMGEGSFFLYDGLNKAVARVRPKEKLVEDGGTEKPVEVEQSDRSP